MESSKPASEQLKRSRPSSSPDSSPDSSPPTDIIQNPAIPSLPSSSEEKIATEKQLRKTIAPDLKDRVPQLKLKPKVFEPNTFASWEKGEPSQFIFFALTCEAISQVITKRSMIQDILCNMYRTVMHTTPEDLIPVVYLSANSIAPAYEGLELEIDKNLIISALTEACGKHKQHVKDDHKAIRDLGKLAQKTCSSPTFIKKRVDALTIREVFNTLRSIAKESEKTQSKENCLENKKNYIKTLFAAAFDCEPNPNVWEVRVTDLTISPLHRAAWGVVDKDMGISIRSPQLLGVPPDKAPKDASSSEKVTQMYLNGDNG